MRRVAKLLVLVSLLALMPRALPAQINAVFLDPVTAGLSSPILVTHAGDGSGRLFIVEQTGAIRIWTGSALLATPFLNIGPSGLGLTTGGSECGLLGLAFHPNYASNGFFYISYTQGGCGDSVIARYSVSGDPNVANTAQTIVIGPINQPEGNHNGGHIAFGPDTFLYIGLGDGGGGGDVHGSIGNGQDITTILGSLLRIDVDSASPYAIPPDNPFAGATPGVDEIYAYGLRNPWRFSFDRDTGRLFLGDVGQGAIEEIDEIVLGGNYGWRRMEGTACFNPASGCQTGSLLLPINEYSHAAGRCSVTGGYMYRGTMFPALDGYYFYGDYCSGDIWALNETSPGVWNETFVLDAGFLVSSFGEDEAGEVYVCNHGGEVLRISNPVATAASDWMSF